MLLAAAVTLEPLDNAPRPHARQVQRWFKDSFECLDKALFDAHHRPNVARAYTLTGVYPPTNGHPEWLRITSLQDDLSALLAERLLPDLLAAGEVTFDADFKRGQEPARFAVRAVLTGDDAPRPAFAPRGCNPHDPAVWAGRVEYGELVTTIMRQEHPPLELNLHFHTCTSFRQNAPEGFKCNLPLPVPRYVFQSHLRQWEALAPARLPVPLAPFLEHYVWVAYHNIRGVSEEFGGGARGKVMGFAGRAAFGLAGRRDLPAAMQRDWRHYVDVLRLLSAYSFYAGTGSRTSHGLGQTLPTE